MKAEDQPDAQPLRGLEGEFEVLRELGRGGTSVVYLAVERELDRKVAIKTIHPVFATDPEAVARLVREARTLARLQHPNIVTFYGVRHLADGGLAVVMQYVRGDRLKDRIRARGPLPAEEARSVLADVARALAHAHRHRVVHRDIKPENIFLDSDLGVARLSDFGIARPWDSDGSLTQAGLAIGTPAYMAPEQIDGGRLDGRSDLYSLGLVGWEMLSGERPWNGQNLYGIIYKQKHEALPSIASLRGDVPGDLLEAIERALRKEPQRRWPSADAFLEFLVGEASTSGSPGPAASAYVPPGDAITAGSADLGLADDSLTVPYVIERAPTSDDALTVPFRAEPPAGSAGPAQEDAGAEELAGGELELRPSEEADAPEPDDAALIAQIQWALSPPLEEPDEPLPTEEPRRRVRPAVALAAGLALALAGGLGAISLLRHHSNASDDTEFADGAPPQAAAPASAGEAYAAPAPTSAAGATSIPEAPPPPDPAPATEPEIRPARGNPITRTRVAPPPPPVVPLDSTQLAPAVVARTSPRLLGQSPAIAQRSETAGAARPPVDAAAAQPAPTPPARPDAGAVQADLTDTPPLTPFDVAPVLRNREEVRAALARFYPASDDSQPSGRVVVWVLVDEHGNVQRTQIKESSRSASLDRAAQQVAGTMSFSPATKRDRKVSVWVAVPIDFAAR